MCDGNYAQETKGRGFKCAYVLSRHRGATERARRDPYSRRECVISWCVSRAGFILCAFISLKMREELYDMVKHVKIKRFAFTFFQL